jgi:putative lipoic acid-binding regulatory protein
MPTHSGRRYKTSEVIQPGEAHEAIPGLHHDIVVTPVLSCANMGPVDIARLRSVSRAMYDAVEATGRVRDLEEIQDLYQKLADITYVHATTPRDMHRRYQYLTAIVRKFGKPDLFVTVTCNPEWPEMAAALLESNTPADRPDIVGG